MIRAIHSIDTYGTHVKIPENSPYLHKINHYLLSRLQDGDRIWIKDSDGYLCCKVDSVAIDLASTPVVGPHFFSYRLTCLHRTPRGSGSATRTIDMGHETNLYYIDILEVHKLLFPEQKLDVTT